MRAIKIILGVFAGLWLLTVILIGAGGAWLSNNPDVVAEAAVEASGIKEQVARAADANCKAAEERYNMAWNRAVDSNQLDAMEDSLRMLESEAKATCA
ncbi:hypothetical protein [Parerythrobacter lacustris]|uniref:Uncharacterized protein n=1 Tax=Parerythrobacter lacustris TaxID=2969984 RepID=A0ABT1XNA0_9SPHN|nr:hypothetical protein [Parerythrobacter lacustris]MCR2833128.1 hypothetical protein [Parerythrobacter lacustris]